MGTIFGTDAFARPTRRRHHGENRLSAASMAVVLLLALAMFIAQAGCREHASDNTDASSQMVKEMRAHRYQRAVEVGVQALRGDKFDDLILREIAMAYILQASDEPQHASELLDHALDYSERSIRIDPENLVNTLEVGWGFEEAGRVDTRSRCKWYERASKLYQGVSRSPLLTTTDFEVKGQRIKAEPVKRQADDAAVGIAQKLAEANCGR